MPASRFTQYGAQAGMDQTLQQMVAARIEAQMEAQKQQQIQIENRMRQRQISQGDERIDLERQGLDLASKPKPAGPITVAPGASVIDPSSGRIIASAPDRAPAPERPVSLSPGGRLVMPSTGATIASAPDRPQAATQPSEAGWSIQQVSDPKTNTTSLMRVNSRTGEAQPVALPNGVQPGGQRQTRLSTGQQEELATMKTVEDMTKEVNVLGDSIGWKGVGALFTGSLSQGAANLGWGSPNEEKLRNKIANIQGTIAKLRGGTSFTPNEQKLLDSYTPTINDGDMRIKAKLESLREFIATKRKNTMQFAGADMGGEQPQPAAGAPVKWGRDANGKPVRVQ